MKIVTALLALSLSVQAASINISAKRTTPDPDDKQLVFTLSSNVFNSSNIGSYTHEKLLKCQPEIKGAYEFSSRNTLTLYPSHALQAGSSYSCQLNKTKYTQQSRNKAFFTTEKLYAVIERFGKMLTLKFNTQVDPKKLKSLLTISRSKNLAQTSLNYELSFNKSQHRFVALIKEDVTRDNLHVSIDKMISPSLTRTIEETLGVEKLPQTHFDPKRKTMALTAAPRFLAQTNGKLAIRLYLPHYFYSSTPIRPFISIKGLETFTVGSPNYLYSDERRKYNISKDNQRYVDISGDFQSGKSYQITIRKGLKAAYNYQLRRDQKFTVTMGDRKQYISFESNKPYLSSAGQVGISAVNTQKATIIVEHLMDQNYRYFVTFKGGHGDALNSMSKEVARKTFELGGKKNSFSQYKVDIKTFMKDFKSGVYRLSIHYDKDKTTSKSVYFSDIGITTKVANNQMFIWTTKLSNSKPIEDAEIKIYSHKNELIKKLNSDGDGVAILDLNDIAGKHPKSIVVATDDEQSFLYLNQELSGVRTPYEVLKRDKYKTFIYLQSKLIRPGNDAHILMLLKDKNYLAGSKLPLKVIITDPTGYKVYNQSLQTNEHGAIDLKFFIADNFKTGKYRIHIKLGKYTIGSSVFSVENFIPQKIKNKILFKESTLKLGDLLHATVSSQYLFGTPGSNLKAKARLTAVSKVYTNDRYKGFNFNNELLAKTNVTNYLLRNKNLKLNAKGSAKIIFDTTTSQNPPSILQAQLALTVFDGGRGVAAYKKIDIFPYSCMVGLKLKDSSIQKGDNIKAETIAIEPQKGEKLSRKLEVVIKKRHWEYYYDSRGYYRWHKRFKQQNRFYIQSGQPIDIKMPNSGDYTLEVADRLSGHSSTRNFRVSGWDYTPIDPTSDMGKVQVNIDKKRAKLGYKRGDTLHIDIKSPLKKGHMLLSLESDKVLWHKVISIDKASASLDINLDFDISNGAYLRTHMVRSTNTPFSLTPFRASSATFIKPNKRAHQQSLTIKAPKLTTSNHLQEIKIHAKANSSVIVSVVDEGILQIKGQLPPKPFRFFERIVKEQIALYDLYDKVMHFQTKGKLLSFGGDGSAKMRRSRKHIGPKTGAKRVKPFVYWSNIVKTNAQGLVSVKVPIPAFNGQAKIVAIAFDETTIGSTSEDIVIKDDIIIKPTFSRFIHIGDELQVPVRIFNTSKIDQKITLSTTTSPQLSFKMGNRDLSLKPNSSQLITATLKANSFGKGDVKIIALNGDGKTFEASVELPVTSAFALQTKVYKGESSKRLTINVDKRYFSASPTQLYMTISDSYLSQLRGSVNTLIGYPHGCAEQTSSKLLAMLYIDKFVKGANDQHTKDLLADRKRFIQEGIYKLHGMQKYGGEFGYWKSSGYINPYASIYASDVILELKRQGFDIPNDMISKIYKALRNQSRGYGRYRYGSTSYFERMYAAYLLSREKQLDSATVNSLYDQKVYQDSVVSRYMMAAILKEAKLFAPLNKVFAELEGFHYNNLSNRRHLGGSFYSKNRDLAFALYIHVTHFKKNDLSAKLLEGIAREMKHSYSTQDRAFIMRAMLAYYKDSVDRTMSTNVNYNKQTSFYNKSISKEDTLKSPQIVLSPKSGIVNYAFEVSNYIEKELRHLPLYRQSSTIKVNRIFVDDKDNPIDPSTLNVGDLFYSKISVQSAKNLKNIVVSNRIPACFEIINERLQNHQRSNYIKNSSNYRPDHEEYLDDKVLSFINMLQPLRVYSNITRSYSIKENTQTFYQAMRILAQGRCQFPAVVVEAMYDGRITSYDKAYKEVTIKKNSKQKSRFNLNKLLQKW